MKRILIVIMVLLMVLGLMGCEGENKTETQATKEKTEDVELSEADYKAACLEYDYTEMIVDETTHLNDCVKKDFMVAMLGTNEDTGEEIYVCRESTGNGGYVTPNIYVYDRRSDKTRAIELYDKMFLYGEIVEISEYMTWDSAGTDVVIEAKYVEFNGTFGE